MTCLHLAALSGCVSACAYLIDLGCDINSDAKELKCFCNRRMGLTPLYLAVTSGDPQTVSLLLQHGAEVDVTVYEEDGTWLCERGITPLHQAARLNHATICELLCDEGADVNARCYIRNENLHGGRKPFDGSVKLRPIDLVEENPHAPSAALPLHEEHLIVNRGAVRAERAAARTREVLIAAGKKKRRSDDSPLSARRGMSAMFERLRL